jgi:16S rRNA processing protein RimM
MPDLCLIGSIAGVHGIRGALSVISCSDIPGRFTRLDTVYIGKDLDSVTGYRVTEATGHGDRVLLNLEGISDRNQAEALKGNFIYVKADQMEAPPEGRYFIHDLIGCDIVTMEGERKGVLSDVMLLPANDVYVADCDGREVLIPAVPAIVRSVDINQRRITVEAIDGLFEDDDED